MKPLPATIQTTYANLLQAHLNRPVFEFEGSPFTRKLGTKTYWYANQRTAPGAPLKQRRQYRRNSIAAEAAAAEH